jgi:hypothetical protein
MVPGIKVAFSEDGVRYLPGSEVKGEVVVNVEKPKDYTEVTATLLGGAHVHWTESHGSGDSRTFTNRVSYVEEKVILWSKEDAPSGELAVGEHTFPFQFVLPQDIPPSFKGGSGQVSYGIKAELRQGKSGLKTEALINVEEDTSALMRSSLEPQRAEKDGRVQFLCFNYGSVSMNCSLPHTGFSPGDAIPISVNLDNQSSRTVRIHASLVKHSKYTSGSRHHRILNNQMTYLFSPTIQAREVTSFEGKSLKIHPEAVPTLRSCSCISVEYYLVVKAVISRGSDFLIQIPVVIAKNTSGKAWE